MSDPRKSSDAGSAAPDLAYRTKTDLVTDYLRTELQAGRPGPGERLVVARVAAALKVSKIPVREAVTRLVGEGLLVQTPNVGPTVPDFSAHEIVETAIMRVALESAALESAVARHDHDSLAVLAQLLAEMDGDDVDFPALNVRFHLGVVDPSPYRELVRSIHSLQDRAARYVPVRRVPGYRDEARDEHRAILAALRAGDAARLLTLNRDHVLQAARRLADQVGGATA